MSILSRALEEKEFDIRVTQRNLAKGKILHEELDRHLKKLPDETANAEYVSIEDLDADDSNDSRSGRA